MTHPAGTRHRWKTEGRLLASSVGVRQRCECGAVRIVHRSRAERGYDPECSLRDANPAHICLTSTGEPAWPGQRCFHSARLELKGAG